MKSASLKILKDYSITALIAVAVALSIRTFVVEAYRIPNDAMKPTLFSGDLIFVSKMSYKFPKRTLPKRGDVIIFSDTVDPETQKSSDYIKRIIGLPGDRVSLKNGGIILNGKKISSFQPFAHESCVREELPNGKAYEICAKMPSLLHFASQTIPENSVFVIGDLRNQMPLKTVKRNLEAGPKKSKGWGIIPLSSIKGRATLIWLSIDPHRDFGSSSSHWVSRIRFDRMFREVL